MKRIYNLLAIAAVLSILFSGCRKDDIILPPEEEQLPPQEEVLPPEEEVLPPEEETSLDTITSIVGFYLLNEGNMAMNKASLDYYDYGTSIYKRNVYGQANPDATLGLGDVGNDIGIYGSKLYTVINASNKLEIMDVATTKRLGVIDIKNGRYITFANGKAYAFNTNEWKDWNFHTVVLHKIIRQNSQEFIKALNSIRIGEKIGRAHV